MAHARLGDVRPTCTAYIGVAYIGVAETCTGPHVPSGGTQLRSASQQRADRTTDGTTTIPCSTQFIHQVLGLLSNEDCRNIQAYTSTS